jgi:hypothetical protein
MHCRKARMQLANDIAQLVSHRATAASRIEWHWICPSVLFTRFGHVAFVFDESRGLSRIMPRGITRRKLCERNQYCLDFTYTIGKITKRMIRMCPRRFDSRGRQIVSANLVLACYLAQLEGCPTEDNVLMALDLACLAADLDHRLASVLTRERGRLGRTQLTLSPLGSRRVDNQGVYIPVPRGYVFENLN